MRMLSIILGIFGILAITIMFLVSGCNTQFFDPQYYEFRGLMKNESGTYIFDKELYDEAKQLNNGDTLSNGYKLIYDSAGTDIEYINNRVMKGKRFTNAYIDNDGQKHFISYSLCFEYITYGLWLKGDEGGGFWFASKMRGSFWYNMDNVFYYDKKTDTFIKKDNNDK